VVTKNLNKIIDINLSWCPRRATPRCATAPSARVPADTFIMLRMLFESDVAQGLNRDIFWRRSASAP